MLNKNAKYQPYSTYNAHVEPDSAQRFSVHFYEHCSVCTLGHVFNCGHQRNTVSDKFVACGELRKFLELLTETILEYRTTDGDSHCLSCNQLGC